MSIICQTFVQNAWRSDLCSNCFKSLADHSDSGGRNACERLSTPRYVPQATTLYQSRGISSSLKWRLNESLYEKVSRRDFGSQTSTSKMNQKQTEQGSRGILIKNSTSEKKIRSRPSVDFAEEEALVIGYGGNDYDSDHSPWEMGSDDGSIDLDLLDDTDEDRKISKLTKNNTEFNSFNKNLLSEESSNHTKKDEEKLNSINNNFNNCVKNTDKALNILNCVTYNDIQPKKTEKKLNQYYFPSSTESLRSYLHGNSVNIEDSLVKNNNELSQISDNLKIENCKRDISKSGNTSSRIVFNEDFTPLNTRTYSFVSELNRNNINSEQSSDSDYSTCRHTAGDSTDSESFHDAEDSRALPCSSFLHGGFPTRSTPTQIHNDKKYDAGSSTSGDVSNLSDDSDAHETTVEKSTYKSRTSRSAKTSPQTENKHSPKSNTNSYAKPQKNSPTADAKQSHVKAMTETAQKDNQTPVLVIKKSSSSPAVIQVKENSCRSDMSDTETKESKIKVTSKTVDGNSSSVDSRQYGKLKIPEQVQRIPPTVEVSTPSRTEINRLPISSEKDTQMDNSKTNGQLQKSDYQLPKISKSEQVSIHPDSCRAVTENKSDMQTMKSVNDLSKENICDPVQPESPYLQKRQDSDESTDCEKSPDMMVDRQSKLAALALELELARRDSAAARAEKSGGSPAIPVPPPEVKAKCSPQSVNSSFPSSPTENYPTIKKSSAISCASRLSTVPDVSQESPTKQKKSKFSLKKLLKRNKDSGTFTPAGKEVVNPKAWKKQTFDRSRLSLEIVHPMDLTSDPPTSTESTPTEEHRQIVSTNPGKIVFRGVGNRARSLSALPQLSSEFQDTSGIALLECRKMDTVPARKAGTVAERKKNRPSLVRTPSCSALPNRPVVASPPENSDRAPPPKPPPPPKCKVMQPPPPPPPFQPRSLKQTVSPARPPPPKIPDTKVRGQSSGSSKQELHDQNRSDKEYANLGDIRSLLTPKKPERPSAFSAARETEMESKKNSEEIYETLHTAEEEEDHYTYLDELETKTSKKKEEVSSESMSRFKTSGESQPCGRPWLDLQTSYAAIAAANYESLAELITTSLNESMEYFQTAGRSLKWRDFHLETEEPIQIVKERAIYNGACKSRAEDKVTLMVSSRKQILPQNARNHTRYPVLASFNDYVPRHPPITDNSTSLDLETASVYVLQQSRITTVSQFARISSSDNSNQHIHLRDYCFVLLQLIHTLKSLQAEGIEEINYDLQILILVITNEEKPPILVLFPEDKNYLTLYDSFHNKKTLCQATLETMLHLLHINTVNDLRSCIVNGEHLAEPVAHTFKCIATVLSEEKASSLSQAKGFLEYMLWGPVDVKISQDDTEGIVDTILQRWLDLQRAQMVKSTIAHLQTKKNSQAGLHVYEEYQLIFLLQASVKSLKNVISKL